MPLRDMGVVPTAGEVYSMPLDATMGILAVEGDLRGMPAGATTSTQVEDSDDCRKLRSKHGWPPKK